jgi:hypothetical protein
LSSDVISLVRHAIQEYGSPYAVVDHENLSVFEKKALGSMLMKEVAFRIGYGAEDTKGKDLCIVNNYEDPSSASVIDYASQVFHVSDTDFISGALKSFQQDMKGYYLCVGNKLYPDDVGWLGDFFYVFFMRHLAVVNKYWTRN